MKLDFLPEQITVEGLIEDRTIFINNNWLNPDLSLKIRNHSPDGFNWGYGGSGPAQLALAILLEFLPVHLATRYYQDFKFKVVASWPQGENFITVIRFRSILQGIADQKQ